ncbi:MAG: MMPL family transporter [Pseudomonadales bacterium]|nr:MMPL family transporter [Pseudomonadales bacterium]
MTLDNFSQRFQDFVLNRPWVSILLSGIFIALSSYGLLDIKQESDPRQFFSDDDPQYKYFKQVEDQYAGNEMVGFIIHPKNDKVFTRDTLSLLEELTEEAWTIPHSTRVDSLINFQHTEVNEDDLSVEYLVDDAKSLSDAEIEKIKNIALGEPLIINSLISEEGHVSGLFVKVQMDDANIQASEITRFAEGIRDRYRKAYPDVDIYMVGTVVFTDAATVATMNEMKLTMPLGFLIVIVLMLLMVKNVYLTIITLGLVLTSIMAGVGLGGWAGIMFSPMVGAAPAMILTLVVANCVHILVTYQLERSRGLDRRASMAESMRVNLQPVFLTCSTTAIGFLCLNFSDSPPFHDLGNMVALGVMVAYILSVVLLPAMVMVGPVGTYKQKQGISHLLMDKLGGQIIRLSGPIFVFMVAFVLASLWFIKDNELNDIWNEYFDETFEIRAANDFMMSELTGMNRLDFSFPGRPNVEQSVMDPEFQRNLNAFVGWAKSQPGIVSATGYSDILKRLNRDLNGGNIESFVIPDSRPLVSQYTLLYEMSLPFGLGTNNQMTSDKTYSVVSVVAQKTKENHHRSPFNQLL